MPFILYVLFSFVLLAVSGLDTVISFLSCFSSGTKTIVFPSASVFIVPFNIAELPVFEILIFFSCSTVPENSIVLIFASSKALDSISLSSAGKTNVSKLAHFLNA